MPSRLTRTNIWPPVEPRIAVTTPTRPIDPSLAMMIGSAFSIALWIISRRVPGARGRFHAGLRKHESIPSAALSDQAVFRCPIRPRRPRDARNPFHPGAAGSAAFLYAHPIAIPVIVIRSPSSRYPTNRSSTQSGPGGAYIVARPWGGEPAGAGRGRVLPTDYILNQGPPPPPAWRRYLRFPAAAPLIPGRDPWLPWCSS